MITKPKLSVPEQLSHLKNKGVLFTITNEHDALEYLNKNNNYFKLRSYRKNYTQKYDGSYVGLEFAYLRDLSIIDMRIRYCLLEMCLDIEHHIRVRAIKAIENAEAEDGYSVITDFKAKYPEDFKNSIERAKKSPYCQDLVESYPDMMPIWVYVEIAQFGQLINLYRFIGERLDDCTMVNDYYHLQEIRQLRNACAHSNCLINDLRVSKSSKKPNSDLVNAITSAGITPDVRKKKMSNDRVRQITSLLYFYKVFVTSEGLKKHQSKVLYETFIRRPHEHIDYWINNDLIISTFNFFEKIVDKWYTSAYNTPIEQKL